MRKSKINFINDPRLYHRSHILHHHGFNLYAEDEDDGDAVQVIADIGPSVKSMSTSLMDSAIDSLSRELAKLRTGRASSGKFYYHHTVRYLFFVLSFKMAQKKPYKLPCSV